jgi:hypothetical protein
MNQVAKVEEAKLSPSQESYLKSEVEKLNKELEKLLEETRSREKYSLTIIAGIAAWVFTNLSFPKDLLIIKAVSCIPLITTLIYGISVRFLYENILWIGIYLRKIEDHFLKDSIEFGWEKFLTVENKKRKFVRTTTGIWIFQLLLAIFLVIFVSIYKPT